MTHATLKRSLKEAVGRLEDCMSKEVSSSNFPMRSMGNKMFLSKISIDQDVSVQLKIYQLVKYES